MGDTRPEWKIKEISEANFRKIYEFGNIKTVTAMMKMTSVETAREWLTVTNSDGRVMVLPKGWKAVLEFAGYWSNPGLFRYSYVGEQAFQLLRKIDAWEKENQKERVEYERLKAKFESN